MRETPWGYITYLDYRYKVEFNEEQYREIDRYCKEKKIDWMVSVWDEPSVDFMEKFDTPAYKVPSASLTDLSLLKYVRKTGKPITIRELRIGIVTATQPQRRNEIVLGMNALCTSDNDAGTDSYSQPNPHIAPRKSLRVRLAIRRG